MIKDNQIKFNNLRVLLDLFCLVGVYFLTYLLFFHVFPADSLFGGTFSPPDVTSFDYKIAALYIVPLHMIVYALFRLYRPMRVTGRRLEAVKIFFANLLSEVMIMVVFWLFVKPYRNNFSSMFLFELGVLNTFFIVLERNIVRLIVIEAVKKGFNAKKVLLVGNSDSANELLERIERNPRWGYMVYGMVDDHLEKGAAVRNATILGALSDLPDILSANEVDEVFVTLHLAEYEKLKDVVKACEKAGVMTKFVPDYGKILSSKPYTEDLWGLPVIYVRQVPLNDMVNAFVKRAVDIVGSVLAIILFSPVMLITALLIKLYDHGPVIYKQERVGLHNRNFMMYKFRSMVVQTEEAEKKGWTTKGDARITPVGKFIRKTSIDELPQLFNVLSGKMSMIGPRPERPQYVEKFKEEIPRYMVKHQVRPGMTGWAQVNGLRGDTSIEERIRYDIYYIENWSLGLDVKILFLTVFKGFINKNAY